MPLILLLIVAAVLFKFAWLLAAVAVTGAIGWALGRWLARRDDWLAARWRRDAEICAGRQATRGGAGRRRNDGGAR